MAFSNLVMFAIIVSTGATLGSHGRHTVSSAAQAAAALRPIAGQASSVLFALGFIGSGMLAIPVLAGSGAAGMAGLLGKEWGFSRSAARAPVFYGLVVFGTVGGALSRCSTSTRSTCWSWSRSSTGSRPRRFSGRPADRRATGG